jgi:hypothetical protein
MFGSSLPQNAQCPTITTASATSATICAGQSTNLNGTALGTNTVSWYTVATGGIPIGTSLNGANFNITPSASTIYYAEPLILSIYSYSYTGAVQTYTVPPGVSSITVDAQGAAGGAGGLGGSGGLGGRLQGTFSVTPGDVLYIYVGGVGGAPTAGYNGGGSGAGSGGGGGGASDIRINGTALTDRAIVAGGGGGGGQGNGGGGGGTTGAQGSSPGAGIWATGGTQSAGGSGGLYNNGSCAPGSFAANGILGVGGNGVTGTGGCSVYGGSGGGGGYFGGGGMQINGAGGGSSYIANGTHTQGFKSGDGIIVITVPICTNLTRTSVSVSVNPNPTVSVSSGTICSGSSFTLAPTGANSYTYQGGSSIVSPSANTNYTVIGSNSAGCLSTTYATATIAVNSLPSVSINSSTSTICAGASASLTASGAISYSWNTAATATVLAVTPTTNVTYSVTGFDVNGCSNTANSAITVNALPSVAITGTSALCVGNTATLTAGGGASYLWNTGSTSTSLSINPSFNTNYTLTAFSAQGCSNTAVRTITVYALPLVSISGTNAVCAGNSSALTATGANTYVWNTSATTSSIIVTPASTSSYSVNGTSSVGCVASSAPLTVTVNALPNTAISGTTALCAGTTVTLTGSGATTYSWNTGASSSNFTVSPSANSSYTLVGISSVGCTSLAVRNMSVYALPIIAISGTNAICSGGSSTLTASGANNYLWNNSSTNASQVVSPNSNTTYSVTGTSSMGCVSGNSTALTVHPLPVLNVTGTSTICAGGSTTLTASGATAYLWSNSGTSAITVVSPTASASYSVIGTSSMGCINAAAPTQITVYTLPLTAISGTNAVCSGNSVTLTASGAASYVWNNSNIGANIVDSPTTSTTYSVIGISVQGCTTSALTSVTVYAVPVLTVSAPNSICQGDSLVMSVNGANSYVWNNASTNTVIVLYPTSTSNYSVLGTSIAGCFGSAVTTITVNTVPILTISGTNTLCAGKSTTLTVTGADTYSWSNGGVAANSVLSPTANTTYSVIGTNTFGCKSESTTSLIVFSVPVLTLSIGTNTICIGEITTLSVSGATNYNWNSGNTTSNFTVSPLLSTNYSVTGSDQLGCSSTSSVDLLVSQCNGVSRNSNLSSIVKLFPNPNQGQFTLQLPEGFEGTIQIRNVLGQLVLSQDSETLNQLDISRFDKGLYMVTVNHGGQILYNQTIIKQ